MSESEQVEKVASWFINVCGCERIVHDPSMLIEGETVICGRCKEEICEVEVVAPEDVSALVKDLAGYLRTGTYDEQDDEPDVEHRALSFLERFPAQQEDSDV